MIRPTRAVVFGAAAVLFSLCSHFAARPHAAAQWLPDRAYAVGPGLRVGDLELHPGIAVRGGYDTNVFRAPGTQSNPELGSAILAVSPHLHLTTLSDQRLEQGEDSAGAKQPGQLPAPIAFDLGLSATYFHYFREQAPKNLEVDFDSMLNVLPRRRFGFDVGASYARNIRPFTARPPGSDRNIYAFNRVKPALLLRGESRGGVLQGSVGFVPVITLYESTTFEYLNLFQYDVPARFSWKFLPNTALVYDGAVGFNQYQSDPAKGPTDPNASIFLSDSTRLQSRLGINGAISPRIGVRALAGYGVVMMDRGELDDREDAVGEAAMIFAWSTKSSVELGYQRTLEISNLGGWTQLDRGYLKLGALFANVFALDINGGAAHVNYGPLLSPFPPYGGVGVNGATHREDVRLDAGVHGEYRATNWLAFTADFTMLLNMTDFEYAMSMGLPVYPGDFNTFQAYGGVRAHY